MKKALAPTATVGTSNRSSKLIVALSNFIGRSMSQPEAHDLYGETCLHTPVSTLWNTYGLVFIREYENYGPHKSRFVRYTLANASREQAHKLLALKKAQHKKVNVKASESAQKGFNYA